MKTLIKLALVAAFFVTTQAFANPTILRGAEILMGLQGAERASALTTIGVARGSVSTINRVDDLVGLARSNPRVASSLTRIGGATFAVASPTLTQIELAAVTGAPIIIGEDLGAVLAQVDGAAPSCGTTVSGGLPAASRQVAEAFIQRPILGEKTCQLNDPVAEANLARLLTLASEKLAAAQAEARASMGMDFGRMTTELKEAMWDQAKAEAYAEIFSVEMAVAIRTTDMLETNCDAG